MRTLLFAATALAVALTSLPATVRAAPENPAPDAAADHLRLPPPKAGRVRPLVAVVGENAGAETTDFIVPYGVLKDSGVADVLSLSTARGPIKLRLALKVQADATTDEFDRDEPAGADIVVVPAQISPKDKVLSAWVRGQAAKGAVIVSICEGARVLANAGLLEGRRATSHWSALNDLRKHYPGAQWMRDVRYVQDGPVISTAGVSASVPASLALVEAIGGHDAAAATAMRLGVRDWSAAHRSADFDLAKGDVSAALKSALAVWTHETVEIPLADGVDEVALALRADAWSWTFRTKVATTSAEASVVRSKHGLMIIPDSRPGRGRYVMAEGSGGAVSQLEGSLAEMQNRYGAKSVRFARLAMEYDGPIVAQ